MKITSKLQIIKTFRFMLKISSFQRNVKYKTFQKDADSLTTIFINTQDRANLFATIIGVLDSENINFVDAKLFGMKNGYCTDLITISDNGKRVELDSEKAKKF